MANLHPDHVDGIVAQWQTERPELDVASLETIGRLLRAAELANHELTEGLRQFQLPAGWFDLLAALRRAGSPYELNPTTLMRAMMLSSGGVTKRLDAMVAARLVERRPDPGDRRGTLVRLTGAGKATIDEAIVIHVANGGRLLTRLTRTDRRRLDAALRTLVGVLETRHVTEAGRERGERRASTPL